MAKWRLVKGSYAVSDDGKSLRHDRHTFAYRFDTPAGWIDLSVGSEGGPYNMVLVVCLPIPGHSCWRRCGGEYGAPMTEDDVVQMKIDVGNAFEALGSRCRLVDNERVY
jgi:hypothetical protein